MFLSLLVARLITPVIAAFTLRSQGFKPHLEGRVMTWYLHTLRRCIRHRGKTIGFGVLFFALSVVALVFIPKSAFPVTDIGNSQIAIELPPGVRLEQTAAVSKQVTDIVLRHKEVSDVVESIGSGDDGQVREATLYVSLVPRKARALSQKQWEELVAPELRAVPDARVQFSSQSGFSGRDVTLYITGDDPLQTEASARRILAEMRGLRELRDPRINGDMPRPELVIKPRLDLAAELGVTVQAISQTIRIATMGDIPQNGAKFSLSDRQVPIRVSLRESAREDLATIENLPVPTASGGSVPLKAVAEVTFGQGPAVVRRYNQSRRVMIDADLAPGAVLGDAQKRIDALPSIRNLPPGVRNVPVGNFEIMQEMFTNFLLAIAAGVLMVFAVLVLLFARVFQPMTILSALPLSLGGALAALFLFQMPFSLPVVIGMLMLMGIVAKNSILLVDFAIEEMRAGRDRTTALVEAGHKRAQPIVMTTVAMTAGMIPAAVSLSGDAAFRAPMGTVVIGGLCMSTLLTLLIVPAGFSLADGFEKRIGPMLRRALLTYHPDHRTQSEADDAGAVPAE